MSMKVIPVISMTKNVAFIALSALFEDYLSKEISLLSFEN